MRTTSAVTLGVSCMLAISISSAVMATARRDIPGARGTVLRAPGPTPVGKITEYPIPHGSAPFLITLGPDGAMWFAEDAGRIGRLSITGVFAQYSVPARPFGIAAGSDGALWFTDSDRVVGRVTTQGKVTLFSLGSGVGDPTGITPGPDGALWFAAPTGIGRITTSGHVTTFPQALASFGITTGPDGALWYSGGSGIGRLTTSGTVTTYPIRGQFVRYVANGPDGKIWFTQSRGCQPDLVGKISTTGRVRQYEALRCSVPTDIALGPDGALWYTEARYNHIARITVDGRITRYPVPTANAVPYGIAAGPDGAMWFTETRGVKIGRIQAI
jgi:virginiamycin B lyase